MSFASDREFEWVFCCCFFNLLQMRGGVMVFSTTLSNILVISWQAILLVEETRVPGENLQPTASH